MRTETEPVRAQGAEEGYEVTQFGVADLNRRHAARDTVQDGIADLRIAEMAQPECDWRAQFTAIAVGSVATRAPVLERISACR
jgi:hypothetical protein